MRDLHISTTWAHDRGDIDNKAYVMGSNTIKIESVQFKHTGRYSCFGLQYMNGSAKYFVAHAELVVYGKYFFYFLIYV